MNISIHLLPVTAALVGALLLAASPSSAVPLTTLKYHIVGVELRVSPVAVSVPKGIAGSVLVELVGGGAANSAAAALGQGAYVEAVLHGPSFDARRVVGPVNGALVLPPLNLVGDYQLDNIRLVDAVTGAVRLEGTPASVPVRVFDEVLVSRVTSRPLTYDEVREKGIVIDEQNFRAVEFEVGFVLDGKTIPVKFPVVAPSFQQSTEIIPKAELEAALAEASVINQQIAGTVELPPELQTAQINFDIVPVNFQRVEEVDIELNLKVPPIPALVVIPGNIGFLNQFFSVQIFTENAAPGGSGLSVHNVKAELVLPPGPDLILSTNYFQPNDDPLRFARVGTNGILQTIVSIVRPGVDGQPGTPDDIGRLYPGEQGQGEFLVEGLQEGLHVMDLNLTADLDGLAAGTVKITGKAAGSVLVRNPKFSLAFTHPRTVRSGEPYDASVTILNTGTTDANQVSVTLNGASLSGGVLESEETVSLGNIAPGQTATATWRVRAQRTGAISFSNLTTGDNSVQGRFRLRMGIDERGVALSPDTLAMPDFATNLPPTVLAAANRVLGQALSVATAGQLPVGVSGVPKWIITKRVLELAEAGQRLAYGDTANRVLLDLMLDWQGARNFQPGFDEILRVTNAGREWREAVMGELERGDSFDAVTRLVNRVPDVAGRGEAWKLAASSVTEMELSLLGGDKSATFERSEISRAAAYSGARGGWVFATSDTNCVFQWKAATNLTSVELCAVLSDTNGIARQLRWSLANIIAGACYRLPFSDSTGTLLVDTNADGTADGSLAATILEVNELPPEVLSVRQDMTVNSGRPRFTCDNPEPRNYGTVVAVLFSKPMRAEEVSAASAYRLDNGVSAGSVQIQPGGRVALANLRQGISAIIPRHLTVSGITDPRGNPIRLTTLPVVSDYYDGATIRGRVVRADGTPAVAVPVTLTMYESDNSSAFEPCRPVTIRVSQTFTEEYGRFTFDFVLAGVPYSVSATDTAGLTPEAIGAILEASVDDQVQRARLEALANSAAYRDTLLGAFATAVLPEAIAKAEGLDRAVLRDLIPLGSARIGTEMPIALRFRGKGTVTGQVLAADGTTPIPGAAVNLYPDPGSRQQPRGVFADSNGRFAFQGVPLGVFTIDARDSTGLYRIIAGELLEINATKDFPIVLAGTQVVYTEMRGRVYEADGITPHGRGKVFIGKFEGGAFGGVAGITTADAEGWWSVPSVPSGTYDVVAVSFDGKRKAERRDVDAVGGDSHFVTLLLQSTAVVSGKVEFANGQAAANALVAGGTALVRTDTNGLFTLLGVPTGLRTLSAAVERNTNAGVFFPRIGSASLNVVPGAANSVVIRLPAAGRIVGHVYDATGTNPVPNVRVVIPGEGGFQWVNADARGYYAFENMGPGGYRLSSPGPAVFNTDTSGLIAKIKEGTEQDVLEALTEAFAIFTGAADPYLNGSGLTFNPLTWGFTTTQIRFDGETAVANIQFLRQGTIAGKVVNGQGVPIGARVRLTGLGPNTAGAPTTIIRGERNTDPALGTFEFPLSVFEGAWTLQAASPFYPEVITLSGISFPPNRLDYTNIVLQFPPVQEVNGRLVGNIFNPDGSPAGSNVTVRVSFGNEIRTDASGFYDTQIAIPKGAYAVWATNEAGLTGMSTVQVVPGITNVCNVRLLGKGALEVEVKFADGSPAPNAYVMTEQGNYPNEKFGQPSDATGRRTFGNLWEGTYGVCVSWNTGIARIMGRASATVVRGATNRVVVYLAPTATIQGRFVLRDGVTGVDAAQVAIGNIGYTTTDANGAFFVEGVPLGTYRLLTQNPINGVGAKTFVTLSFNGQTNNVTLIEQSRGEIRGYVINSYATGYVPGALVTLNVQDELTPPRSVTTGPDGAYNFPGTPAAPLTVTATDPVSRRSGSQSATLGENVATLQVDVQIERLARLGGIVYLPDGVTRATNATVTLTGPNINRTTDTDTNGHVAFADLPLGNYSILARDLRPTQSRSVGRTSVTLNQLGDAPEFSVRLLGVGSVSGTVVLSDGVTPIGGAVVTLVSQTPLFYGQSQTAFTDFSGRFNFNNVPNGTYCLLAEFLVLGVNHTSAITNANQNDVVNLPLGASGTVRGTLVRADGFTPVADVDVLLTFRSQSSIAGYALARTATNGMFTMPLIPLGDFSLEANAPLVNGIARLKSRISFNLELNQLGKVVLDEADPFVIANYPANGAGNVGLAEVPTITFSEAVDPASLDALSIYFCSGAGVMIPATPTLDPGSSNRVRLVRPPNATLLKPNPCSRR